MDHKASPDWAVRRRIIILTLLWEAILVTSIIGFALVMDRENSLAETALINLLWLMGSTIGAYVFGAIWDSKSQRSASIAQSAVDNTDTETTTTVEVKP